MSYFTQIFQNTRTGRAFDFEIITIKEMVAFKSLKDQVINRKPDRTSPVGIAAKQIGITLAGYIVDTIFLTIRAKDVGVGRVNFRKGAYSVRREKFILV